MVPRIKALLKRFISEEHGLENIEYAVMAALIVGAIVLAIVGLTGAMTGVFLNTQEIVEGVE